MQLTTCT